MSFVICIHLCDHHTRKIQNVFIISQTSLVPPPTYSSGQQPTICFLIGKSYLEFHISAIIVYVCARHFLLCIMFSSSVYAVDCICALFPFIAGQYSTVWWYHNLFIHSPTDGHLGCFSLMAITYETAMNIPIQVFVWKYVFISPGQIARYEKARS